MLVVEIYENNIRFERELSIGLEFEGIEGGPLEFYLAPSHVNIP